MRIGSFFGQTAPMLVLESDRRFSRVDQETLEESALLVCRSFSSRDLAIEFTKLKQALQNIEVQVKPGFTPYGEQFPDAVYNKGKVVGQKSEDEATEFEWGFAWTLARKVLLDSRIGVFYDLGIEGLEVKEVRGRMTEISRKALEEKGRVTAKGLKALANKVVKQYRTNSVQNLEQLKEAFQVEITIADRFATKNGFFAPCEDTRKILDYYVGRLSDIERLQQLVVLETPEEQKVFDTPFSALVRRNPISLFYVVSRFFEYTKNKHSVFALERVRSVVQENLNLFQKLRKERVYLKGETDEEQFLSREKFSEVLLQYGQEKADFFRFLVKEEMLNTEGIPVVTTRLVGELYDMVSQVTEKNLIKFFGLSESADFELINRELQLVGIYGFNLRCLDLLANAIANTVLFFDNRVEMTPQEVKAIDTVVEDVQALLDSLCPIGEELR